MRVHTPLAALLVLGALAGTTASGTAAAQASRPLLLTVEAHDASVDADAIRAALGRALGVQVVSLMDEGSDRARRSVSVAFEKGAERARIRAAVVGLAAHAETVRAPAARAQTGSAARGAGDEEDRAPGAWIVPEIVRVLHAMETADPRSSERLEGCLDVLDPWRQSVPGPELSPWDASAFDEGAAGGTARAELREARRNERAAGLTAPRPRSSARRP